MLFADEPGTPDLIGIGGTMQFLKALDVTLEEPVMLAVQGLLSAPTMGELSRNEFIAGWDSVDASTIPRMKAVAAEMRKNLPSDKELFKRTYKHAFMLAKAPGQKGVQLKDAIEFWKMLFGEGGWVWRGQYSPPRSSNNSSAEDEPEVEEVDWLSLWIEFVETHWRKSVSRDLWNQTQVFAEKTLEDPSLEWWSEDAAWPGVVDEFVGWIKQKRAAATAAAVEGEGEGEDGEQMDTN
jgi:DCN1-like protein 1/2